MCFSVPRSPFQRVFTTKDLSASEGQVGTKEHREQEDVMLGETPYLTAFFVACAARHVWLVCHVEAKTQLTSTTLHTRCNATQNICFCSVCSLSATFACRARSFLFARCPLLKYPQDKEALPSWRSLREGYFSVPRLSRVPRSDMCSPRRTRRKVIFLAPLAFFARGMLFRSALRVCHAFRVPSSAFRVRNIRSSGRSG